MTTSLKAIYVGKPSHLIVEICYECGAAIVNPLIFLSYASPDRDRVMKYFDHLSSKGFDVWMDCKRIRGGQNWDFELKKALNKSSIIVIFISNNSVNRRGYVQREIKIALSKYEEKLTDDIYLVPVVIDDDAEIPDTLQNLQFVRESTDTCLDDIEAAIRYQLQQLGSEVKQYQEASNLSCVINTYKDSWDGLPGYDIDIGLLSFSSSEYQRVSDISDCIRGTLLTSAMSMRSAKFEIDLERHNYGQQRQYRTNSYDAHCSEPSVVGKMLFVSYAVHTYFSGAAHPNMHFQTFCFLLDPVIKIGSLRELFTDSDAAFQIIQSKARSIIKLNIAKDLSDQGYNTDEFDDECVDVGTEDWDAFSSFIIREDKLELLFPPYAVAAYAYGPQIAEVELVDIIAYLKHHFICALDKQYLPPR